MTVSRWERGEVVPSKAHRRQVVRLADDPNTVELIRATVDPGPVTEAELRGLVADKSVDLERRPAGQPPGSAYVLEAFRVHIERFLDDPSSVETADLIGLYGCLSGELCDWYLIEFGVDPVAELRARWCDALGRVILQLLDREDI